jgi:hypothetical protein
MEFELVPDIKFWAIAWLPSIGGCLGCDMSQVNLMKMFGSESRESTTDSGDSASCHVGDYNTGTLREIIICWYQVLVLRCEFSRTREVTFRQSNQNSQCGSTYALCSTCAVLKCSITVLFSSRDSAHTERFDHHFLLSGDGTHVPETVSHCKAGISIDSISAG